MKKLMFVALFLFSAASFAFSANYELTWEQPDSHHKYLYNIDVYIVYDGQDGGPNKIFSDQIFINAGVENVSYVYTLLGANQGAYPGNIMFVISPCREYFNGSTTSWYCSSSTSVSYPIADARPKKVDDIFVDEQVLSP